MERIVCWFDPEGGIEPTPFIDERTNPHFPESVVVSLTRIPATGEAGDAEPIANTDNQGGADTDAPSNGTAD